MHIADIGIRLENAGQFAAMQTAGIYGDLEGFKQALIQAYGHASERIYHKLVETHYDYILKQAESLMDATTERDEASLVFWATLAENHEKRQS